MNAIRLTLGTAMLGLLAAPASAQQVDRNSVAFRFGQELRRAIDRELRGPNTYRAVPDGGQSYRNLGTDGSVASSMSFLPDGGYRITGPDGRTTFYPPGTTIFYPQSYTPNYNPQPYYPIPYQPQPYQATLFMLGVNLDTQSFWTGAAWESGARITHVWPGYPADGRLDAGDIVTRVNGIRVYDPASFRAAMARSGGVVTVRVKDIRTGRMVDVGPIYATTGNQGVTVVNTGGGTLVP